MDLRRRRTVFSRTGRALVLGLSAALALGCFERTLRPVNPCTRSRVGNNIRMSSVEDVDLLFMIDNSNSMVEEQASLRRELPRLVRVLASGDRENDGIQDFPAVRSLHIGVITSDIGVGVYDVNGCTSSGDDGALLNTPRNGDTTCSGSYPRVFEFQRNVDEPATFAASVGCVAETGRGGCGWEQQLEAVLKAVSPSQPQSWTIPDYVPPVFRNGTAGHADGVNAGFIRENSALAIIMVTDEEDCSVADERVLDPNALNSLYPGPLPLRCFQYPGTRHPIERYIRGTDGQSGLLGLRKDPNLLIFAGIVGVPVESVPNSREVDYQGILAHELMREEVDMAMREQLRPSCNVPGVGTAYPPRRIVEVARGIEEGGGSATIQSICQESFSGALDAIIDKIIVALAGACLPRELNPDAQGHVQCNVFEVLPPSMGCEGLAGRTPSGIVEVNGVARERCEVEQVGPAGAAARVAGWWYETAENALSESNLAAACPANGQRRIAFSGMSPVTNSEIRLECLQTVLPGSASDVTIGAFCNPAAATDTCASGSSPNMTAPLACDAVERTCAVSCGTSDAPMRPGDTSRCTAAGLLGDVCDTRTWRVAVGADEPGISEAEIARRMMAIPAGMADAPHNFCVNPTCI